MQCFKSLHTDVGSIRIVKESFFCWLLGIFVTRKEKIFWEITKPLQQTGYTVIITLFCNQDGKGKYLSVMNTSRPDKHVAVMMPVSTKEDVQNVLTTHFGKYQAHQYHILIEKVNGYKYLKGKTK